MNEFEAFETPYDEVLPLPDEKEGPRRPSGGLIVPLVVVPVCIALSLFLHRGPKPLLEGAPPTEYAAARAMKHIEAIAREPRPIGSPKHAEAANYVMKELTVLGLEPEVHEAVAVSSRRWPAVSAATVQNVLARMPGNANSGAILLVAHYDSVPNAPGASDDASGVATLLETARALLAGPNLRNDVVFLFTDGEESGLFGARAVVERHPWAEDVALVLNFDGRGTRGPVYMPETSTNNGWLIREMAGAAPHVIASSLMPEVGKRMPNSSDLAVLEKEGYKALNFAFIDGVMRYHSALDTAEHADLRTLQHLGSYALSLTRHFGGLDLTAPDEPDAVYFNPVGAFFVHYPGIWAVPSALLLLGLFWVVVELARFRRNASVGGIAVGAAVFALVSVGAVAAAHYGARELAERQGVYAHHMSDAYLCAFAFVALGLFSAVYALIPRRLGIHNAALGAILWWVALAMATAILMAGASALFVWAPAASLLGLLLLAIAREPGSASWLKASYLSLFAVPALLLFPPLIRAFHVALRLELSGVTMAFLALLIGLLLPLILIAQPSRRWMLAAVCLVTGGCIVGTLYLREGYTAARPDRDFVVYGLDADSRKAVWVSTDSEPDEWTSQFFARGAKTAPVADVIPWAGEAMLAGDAPVAELDGPTLEVLSDGVVEGERWLHLRIRSVRGAPIVSLCALGATTVFLSDIAGNVVDSNSDSSVDDRGVLGWRLHYWAAPPEGIDVWLLVATGEPVSFAVTDQSYGLPALPDFEVEPRPAHIIPQPRGGILFSDATLVTRTFSM